MTALPVVALAAAALWFAAPLIGDLALWLARNFPDEESDPLDAPPRASGPLDEQRPSVARNRR